MAHTMHIPAKTEAAAKTKFNETMAKGFIKRKVGNKTTTTLDRTNIKITKVIDNENGTYTVIGE